jgi:hypothetical protein
VHAFFRLSRTQQMSKLVETLKSHSSRWLKCQGIKSFAWQRGYGCFSVSQSQAATLVQYIENQAEHHRRVSFQEEFREILRRYEIDFDGAIRLGLNLLLDPLALTALDARGDQILGLAAQAIILPALRAFPLLQTAGRSA